jgi:5S rRNA maturation endonuclease (ribonuclease M5)
MKTNRKKMNGTVDFDNNPIKLFEKYITNLKPIGSNGQYNGSCPFPGHKNNDRNPSFSVNKEGIWNCFGCNRYGDAAEFAKLMDEDPKPYYRYSQKNNGTAHSLFKKQNLYPILNAEEQLRAKKYLQYLQDNWDNIDKPKCWTKISTTGLAGYDPKNKRLVTIHTNENGKFVNIKRHKGNNGENPFSVKDHNQARIFPLHLLSTYDIKQPLIIAEGEIDAISLRGLGYQVITMTNGAGCIADDITPLAPFEIIIICYDFDFPGLSGSKILKHKILQQNPTANVTLVDWGKLNQNLPTGYDATDFILDGGTAETFNKLYKIEPKLYSLFQGAKIDWERLTPNVKLYLRFAGNTTDAPDEYVLMSLLAHWAGVVASKIKYRNYSPNFWTVLFGKSSEIRKSTALKVAGKPFKNIQSKFDEEYNEAITNYETNKEIWKDLSLEDKKACEAPKKPIHAKLLLDSDFSDAGFFVMLKDNPISGTIVTTEFADFNTKIKRDYTNQSNALLCSYDGDRMSRTTRKYGTETIPNPTFSILGATTLPNFIKTFSATERENGFLQRIFPVVIFQQQKQRKFLLMCDEMNAGIIQNIEDLAMNWIRSDQVVKIILTKKFIEEFTKWEDKFVTNSKIDNGAEISPHIERMVPGCLKLAMLLESLEQDSVPKILEISIKSLECAIMIVENLFLPSLVYLLQEELIFDKNHLNEKIIEKTIKTNNGVISRSELMISTRLSKIELDRLIETMVEKEMIEIDLCHANRPQGGGNSKTFYSWIGK